jgi:hypothetical protein
MMDKVHLIQKQNNGGGVVLATGTPITNSITDAFIMQKYLQSGELAMLDLQSFDSWIGMFAERVTEFEIDVDTSSYRMATRFSKFHNLPELTSLLSNIADFHRVDPSAGVPEFYGYTNVLLPRDGGLDRFLKNISERADKVRAGKAKAKEFIQRKAIFSITVGSNDFLNNYLMPVLSAGTRVAESPDGFINDLIIHLREQLTVRTKLDFIGSTMACIRA